MPDALAISPDLGLPLQAVIEFWSHTRRSESGCLEWTGTRYTKGYGRYWMKGQGTERLAHRVAYYLATGEWPAVVRHSCDNPPCVEPGHLIGGTAQDNVQDRVARGRSAMGFRNGMHTTPGARRVGEHHALHKLTEAEVAEIRRTYRPRNPSRNALAQRYGVSKNCIDYVLSGKWGQQR